MITHIISLLQSRQNWEVEKQQTPFGHMPILYETTATGETLELAELNVIEFYLASKFGLMALSDSLREEGASFNIKVTAICPGFVATPMVTDAPVPLEEMIKPDDIAKTVLFLLSLSEHAAVREIVITRKGEG